jgi:hypothetical protein
MKVGVEGGLIVAFDGKEHRLLENGVIVFEEKKIIPVGKSYLGARAIIDYSDHK